jgi:hypothetical protein
MLSWETSKRKRELNKLRYMKDGIIPTTTTIHIVKYGETFKEEYNSLLNQQMVEIPLYWLKGLLLVDTPGTNAIIREHQTITEKYIPRSDFVLFITSCERPFSESEKEFMENIKQWVILETYLIA